MNFDFRLALAFVSTFALKVFSRRGLFVSSAAVMAASMAAMGTAAYARTIVGEEGNVEK